MKIHGKIWKFGDDIDTDLIIPARFLNISEGSELAKHCFADLKPRFAQEAAEGDVLVAGRNFGCGSSREHAPLAIQCAGIRVIVAKSFARIFYRNAFNIGLPLIESEEAADALSGGEEVSIDLATGRIEDLTKGKVFQAKPIPEFMGKLVDSGGLVDYIKEKKLKKE